MGRSVRAALLLLLLLGCGGQSQPANGTSGFINRTRHSDADLWTLWRMAQQNLARKIDLNPVQQDTAPAILPGDVRALNVAPSRLTVAPQADIPSSELLTMTGVERLDPTGMIACPQPCNVKFATAYSRYRPATVRYAASWESVESDFQTIVEYEFENQILFALGYDTSWR